MRTRRHTSRSTASDDPTSEFRAPAFEAELDFFDDDFELFDFETTPRGWRRRREALRAVFRPSARSTEQKLPEYARRGTAAFVRTSSKEQSDRDTRGSPSAQLASAYEEAQRIGISAEKLEVIEAFSEAGTRKTNRKKFKYLRSRVRGGHLGIVIVPEHHRLSRNVSDAEAFFQECAEMRVLLVVNGQAFDPRVPTDRYMLGLMAQFAQYENDARIRWQLRGKMQRARDLRARYPLPTGLIWASPTDPTYTSAANAQGLGHYLRRVNEHLAYSPDKEQTYYVLPFPQADIEAAARLRVQWLLEPGSSLRDVLARIQAGHPGWPRPGLVPKPRRSSLYTPGMTWTRNDWETATLSRLGDYLASPSLYGIYSFYMPSLSEDLDRPVRRKGSHGSLYPTKRAHQFPPLPAAADLFKLSAVPGTTPVPTLAAALEAR